MNEGENHNMSPGSHRFLSEAVNIRQWCMYSSVYFISTVSLSCVFLQGEALQRGDISAVELSAYTRPTPPQGTGFHRYQFLIFEQPEGQSLSLSPQENSSRGNWDLQAFVERFGLARPVASLQFLTQNHKD
uniref:Phosphatidylethanolamine binding protein 4 n=1 Tax=Cyprinus carpio TaxID=7962 RepID=A0A8C2K9Y3_CYPCA